VGAVFECVRPPANFSMWACSSHDLTVASALKGEAGGNIGFDSTLVVLVNKIPPKHFGGGRKVSRIRLLESTNV